MAAHPSENAETSPLSDGRGPFERKGVLGEGGSGTVYAVERDGAALALKVLRADLALSSRERQRFLEEAEKMRRLEHRAIVQLIDTGTLDDGRPFIAMPLLVGETLAARLAGGRLDIATALCHFADIADALATIHREGLIHRDVKPENVILAMGEDGVEYPVLLDLGIAREAAASSSTTTEQGNVRGTRAYMAPERFFGVAASIATDVYELGVLLYIMLVGETPWTDGDGAASRLHPRDPEDLGIALPEALRTTLLRALSTRPELRPASMTAFAASVRDAIAARDASDASAAAPVLTAPPVADEAAAPVTEKKRGRAAIGVALLAAAAAAGSLFLATREPDAVAARAPLQVDAAKVEMPATAEAPAPSTAPLALPSPAAVASTASTHRAPIASRKQTAPAARSIEDDARTAAPSIAPPAPPAPPPPAPTSSDRLYMDRK